ncbi:hypothetical protein AB0I95_13980 [Micromonospora sp. NPDC049751]|uniref:hypothetical protein n=1 Tax=unclassified Micromonospora TaxID=2617518 RepID=UPI00341086B7
MSKDQRKPHAGARRLWRILVIVGVVGISGWWWSPTAVGIAASFLRSDLAVKDSVSSVVSMAVGILSLLTSTCLGLIQLRASQPTASLDDGTKVTKQEESSEPLEVTIHNLPQVNKVRALALRVHASIDLDHHVAGDGNTGLNDELPLFVPRENFGAVVDALRRCRTTGGFLLLVGNSSVGKTRLLYEALRKALPDFRLLAPDLGDGQLLNRLADSNLPLSPTVIWLDELQRFIEGPYLAAGDAPVSASAVRKLLGSSSSVVFVATLWPEYAQQLRATHIIPALGVHKPLYPSAVDILDNGQLTEIALTSFTVEERARAEHLALQDPRLAIALRTTDYNVTEVLAGAREVVRRYDRGTKEQRAIIHAAVDAWRLGVKAPLTLGTLSTASRGYLPGHYPEDSWFQRGLNELTTAERPQDRATAPIVVVTSADRRQVIGYLVTDYLLQRLSVSRASSDVPDVAWEAFVGTAISMDDQMRLAESAIQLGMPHHAESLLRRQMGKKHPWRAEHRLALLLSMQGRFEELSQRANLGDEFALDALVGSLMQSNQPKDALAVIRSFAQSESPQLQLKLAVLFDITGRTDEAIAIFQDLVIRGDLYSQRRLLELLVSQGRDSEAIQVVNSLTDRKWLPAFRLGHLDSATQSSASPLF